MTNGVDDLPNLFRIRPTKRTLKESRVGELFQNEEERLWVINQLKLLHHWPITWGQQNAFSIDLNFSKLTAGGEEFFELRLHDPRLSHGGNLRVFFWVDDANKTVWIIHAYWKKTQRIAEAVKRLVARRIRNLKGQIQDGTIT